MKITLILSFFLLFTIQANAFQPAVVSANPQASRVGIDILEKGGGAADAAVAMAFALTVMEPHNSGLGGGGFFLYYNAKIKKFYFIDYREVAPQKATAELYEKGPERQKKGILSVGVPGFLLGMETIHKKWRRISWPAVIEPAIDLAKKGTPLKGLLKDRIQEGKEGLAVDPEMKRLYVDPLLGLALKVNQEDMMETLEDIKTGGSKVFYEGEIAQKIDSFMKKEKGLVRLSDLQNYQVYFRKPHSFEYEGYQVMSAPLPSSGGMGLEYLFRRSIINHIAQYSPTTPIAYQLMVKSFQDYFDYREIALGDTSSNLTSHTTHLCVIDQEGNIAAMTNTLNFHFGSGIIVPGTGIILNNEMVDFSIENYSANRVRSGKRPLSSMAPTIIFRDNMPELVIGTPGGKTIPLNLYQILFSHWVWEIPYRQAIKNQKFYYSPQTKDVVIEEKMSKRLVQGLKMDHNVTTRPSIGNVQALIIKSEKKTIPLSDPRGEGVGYVGKWKSIETSDL